MSEEKEEKKAYVLKPKETYGTITIRNGTLVREFTANDVVRWGEAAKRGDKCGIYGCTGDPVFQCSCSTWYCDQHSKINHIHSVEYE